MLNPREAKKTERGIALPQQTRVLERAIAHGEFCLAAVFGNDKCMRSKNLQATDAAKKIKRARVLVLGLVRRIDVDEVDRLRQFTEALQHGSDAAILQRKVSGDLERRQILPKRRQRGFGVFRKPDVSRTTTYCFDSNSPGTGIEIDEAATIEARRKDIEERFTQAIACGTGLYATRSG